MKIVTFSIALLFAQSAYASECGPIPYNQFVVLRQGLENYDAFLTRLSRLDSETSRTYEGLLVSMNHIADTLTTTVTDLIKGCTDGQETREDRQFDRSTWISTVTVRYSQDSAIRFKQIGSGHISELTGIGLPGDGVCKSFGMGAYDVVRSSIGKDSSNSYDTPTITEALSYGIHLAQLLAQTGCDGEELSRTGDMHVVRYTSPLGGQLIVTFGHDDQMLAVTQSGLAR